MDQQGRIAYIAQRQEEVRQFAAEQRALIAKDAPTHRLLPVGGMVAGAALFGAGMAFAKLLGT